MNQLRDLWNFAKHTNNRDFALEVVKTLGIALTGLGLLSSVWEGLEDRRLAQERLITERFSKAVEQLKSENDLTVRIGGIYALERIAKDSDRDYWTIMDVLTSYVREQAPLSTQESKDIPSNDLQAVLTVISRREKPKPEGISSAVDLSMTNLTFADFKNANLDGANLEEANLYGVDFKDANLKNAVLEGSDLEGADFKRANLEDAKLDGANFKNANLEDANLKNARLIDAQNLTPEQITSACFWRESFYKGKFDSDNGGIFKVDRKANRQYINQLEQNKALISQQPNC